MTPPMTHSEPAREAVLTGIQIYGRTLYKLDERGVNIWSANFQPNSGYSEVEADKAAQAVFGCLSASPAPAAGGLEAVVGETAYAKVRVDTDPKDGWAFVTPSRHPDDIANGLAEGAWEERYQFFGELVALASPAATRGEPVAWIDASALPLQKDTRDTSHMAMVYASRSGGFGGQRVALYDRPAPAEHIVDANKMVPAGLPSEEEIACVIMCARDNGACEVKDWAAEEQSNPHVGQALRQARAVLALFAPILAEKERRIREMAMQALADDQQLTASLDRALAAEAALAAERERCAKVVEGWAEEHAAHLADDAPSPIGRHRAAMNDGYALAAAIRSQGE